MGIARPVMDVYPWAWAFFVPFILIATFTMLNLFIAIIVSTMQAMVEEQKAEETKEIEAVVHDENLQLQQAISELRKEVRLSTQADLYEKLLMIDSILIEHANELKAVFPQHVSLKPSEAQKYFFISTILDFLHLMYLQSGTLGSGLMRVRKSWLSYLLMDKEWRSIFDQLKGEYDNEFIEHLEIEFNLRTQRGERV